MASASNAQISSLLKDRDVKKNVYFCSPTKSTSILIVVLQEASSLTTTKRSRKDFRWEISDIIMGVKNILKWVNGPYVLWEPSLIAGIDFLMRGKLMKHRILC